MDYQKYANQIKLFFLVIKIGGDVFVYILNTLYKGEQPIEAHLIDVADNKSNGINGDEKEMLENIKTGLREIRSLGITLCFKLIQLVCGLEPRQTSFTSQCVWTKRCPKEKQTSLEHLLFKYNSERKKLTHQFTTMNVITDEMFSVLKNEHIKSLKEILEKVGERANLSKQDVKMRQNRIDMEAEIFIQQLAFGTRKCSEASAVGEEFTHRKSRKERRRKSKSENDLKEDIKEEGKYSTNQWGASDLGLNNSKEPKVIRSKSESRVKKAVSGYLAFLFSRNTVNPTNETSKSSSSSSTPIDFSPLIRKTLLAAYGKDLEPERHGTKPYEKSNRIYWINQLVFSDALQDMKKLKAFWKEYEKNES